MKVLVLGAGVIGVSTAWYLTCNGHEVTVVDRQPFDDLVTIEVGGMQHVIGRELGNVLQCARVESA